VIRHSGAQNCFISLSRRDGSLSLQVRDDGRGCPVEGPAANPADRLSTNGTGLHGMSERLCAVGGGLELRPGTPGFCLVATVPMVPVDSARTGVTVTT
jgi:signal transduction histidine kinase